MATSKRRGVASATDLSVRLRVGTRDVGVHRGARANTHKAEINRQHAGGEFLHIGCWVVRPMSLVFSMAACAQKLGMWVPSASNRVSTQSRSTQLSSHMWHWWPGLRKPAFWGHVSLGGFARSSGAGRRAAMTDSVLKHVTTSTADQLFVMWLCVCVWGWGLPGSLSYRLKRSHYAQVVHTYVSKLCWAHTARFV